MADSGQTTSQAGLKSLINTLGSLIKTAQIHDASNSAYQAAQEKCLASVNGLLAQSGDVSISLVGAFVFVNEERLRYAHDSTLNLDFLVREMKKREIGNITFHRALSGPELADFVAAFNNSGYASEPFEDLRERIPEEIISLDRLKKIVEEQMDRRQLVKRTYFNAVSHAKGVMARVKAGEPISLRKTKRVVESLVKQLVEEEPLLLGMTSIKDYDEYTYYHSVNVSILSIALGQRIGLGRRSLEQLGVASLFHDIGKVEVPMEILNKPGGFNEKEWGVMKQHPRWGLRAILRLKGFDDTSAKSAIVAFEHHLHMDGSGYPAVKTALPPNLLTDIVTIADQYDAMTSSRVYARIPLPPDRALSTLQERAGTELNLALVKYFINMVGIFPQGSLVLLDTREMGLVFEPNPNPQLLHRPRVIVVIDAGGRRLATPDCFTVDLTEKDSSGTFKRSILHTLDPNKYRINLSEFLF